MLYGKHTSSLTREEIAMECCDSSLGDLIPNQFNDQIALLKNEGYIVWNVANSGWKITPEGILYVRKTLIKPIAEFVQRPDFPKVLETIPPQSKEQIMKLMPTGRYDSEEERKSVINKKITAFGISNIGALVNLITAVINIISKVGLN